MNNLLFLPVALGLILACNTDSNSEPETGEVTDSDNDTSTDCSEEEVAYNGVDDDCDPATPDNDLDGDGFELADDCDDLNGALNPSATELCNGLDDNCDDLVDNIVGGVTEGYGEFVTCPAVDCADVLAVQPAAQDGVFWIGDDGDTSTAPFEARCDMTTDGGGWTQVLSMNPARMTQYDPADILETRSTVGVVGDENHLSDGFYRVAFSESYLVDGSHGVPVLSDTAWKGGTAGDDITAQLDGAPAASALWSVGSRTSILLRSTVTTDGMVKTGDLRVHFVVNEQDAPDISFPVSTVYLPGERHLVFDSDFGFAGGRVYGEPLYDVETAGLDENFSLYVR